MIIGGGGKKNNRQIMALLLGNVWQVWGGVSGVLRKLKRCVLGTLTDVFHTTSMASLHLLRGAAAGGGGVGVSVIPYSVGKAIINGLCVLLSVSDGVHKIKRVVSKNPRV